MQRTLKLLALGICVNTLVTAPASAQVAPEVTLTRLADCGTPQAPTEVNLRFSDTYAYGDLKVQFVFSCYLIKHGNQYLLWDTGHSMTAPNVAPKTSVVTQLAQLGVKPEQINYVGISHYHADHTGQVASFPQSTLLIGQGDWNAITAPKPAAGVNSPPFAHWISGGGKVEPLPNDKDVFGDGSVIILNTPGHTPGHHSLLVKLRNQSYLITGDLAHFHENYNTNGVPWFNVSRADTLASIDRFKQLEQTFKATVIIQHDARDIGKLPAFPAGAK
ncbi:MAG: N-acyl homoserine lactonase family protein [Betaproteobacteria bacterium]